MTATSGSAHGGATRRVRVYGSVRSAQLERFRTMTPALVLHRERRYDFDAALADGPSPVRQLGRLATVLHLLRTPYDAVELNEPLMVHRWGSVAAQVAAVRLRAVLTRRRPTVGAYCIDITDPADRLALDRRLPHPLARWLSRRVLSFVVGGMDRLAFGTEGSRRLLEEYVDPATVAARARMFPALPQPCDCPPGPGPDPTTVLFVGAFKERKGIRQLLAAWDELPPGHGLRLRLVGKGELLPDVHAWAAGRDDVELVVDPPRAEIHALLRRAHVLVLLSQRSGWWREQVGLPLLEGLAHGCEVVTTDETGIAGWLAEHGHTVVPAHAPARQVAEAIGVAAAASRSADEVRAALPRTDTRIDADHWLLGGRPDVPAAEERRAG
ncbi:glycosyltransferase [Blastococcus mobilis]|uniref:Glycosyltransferase involved in cell wall bisynthesis n=1 Tax=Blastococcus mobilis TaxID=1938746 RepID=A0A238W4T1_9ACTN|nr:glycosyltransferase [Blastococcus mobilis]SNR41498.1 Glycosyltransferase involved in cell wall bisynthesis [Blastococcus mobilis]